MEENNGVNNVENGNAGTDHIAANNTAVNNAGVNSAGANNNMPDYAEFNPQAKRKDFGKGLTIGLLIAVIAVLLVIGIGLATFFGIKAIKDSQKPQVTSALLAQKLEDASDLTTAELTYHGVIHYDDGGIPFLTQKRYSMVYSATVEAGIDLSEVEIEVTDDKVKVKLPKVKLDEPEVDMDSIDFYDDSFALFDLETKEDGIDAVKEAKKDCEKKADVASLESKAYENAKKVVEQLLKDAVGDRELEVE